MFIVELKYLMHFMLTGILIMLFVKKVTPNNGDRMLSVFLTLAERLSSCSEMEPPVIHEACW